MRKLFSFFLLIVALSVPARADWCYVPTGVVGATGLTQCDAHNPTWVACGEWTDGETIYAPNCKKNNSKPDKNKNDAMTNTLIAAGVGLAFIGAMWYIFKAPPSSNNPGQVRLLAF